MELGNMIFGNSRGKYSIDRTWIKHFEKLLDFLNIDSHGFYEDTCAEIHTDGTVTVRENEKYDSRFSTVDGGFENETFLIKPYYWGDDEEEMIKPNFVYKPTGYAIDWYKYPFRDSYSNESITEEEFINIMDNCIESCKKEA